MSTKQPDICTYCKAIVKVTGAGKVWQCPKCGGYNKR